MDQSTTTMQSQELASPQDWLTALEKWQQQLIALSHQLYEREVAQNTTLSDYSFVVFPMAKAYEGFLKKYLLDLGLIDQAIYSSRRFRIGRALNPDVANGQRDELWLFDNITQHCGKEVAYQLWETWLECRNHVFHYFPGQENNLTLERAREYLDIIDAAIKAALRCAAQPS